MIDTALLTSQLRAIAYREYRTRSSVGATSYIWVVLTPIAWIAVVIAAFQILGRRIPISTDTLTFVLSGVIPYMVFRFTVTGVIRARSTYRHIILYMGLDQRLVFITVGLVELSNLCILLVLLVLLNWVVLGNSVQTDIPSLAAGLALSSIFALGFAALAVALDGTRESFTRAVPVILRPSFYLSAVFYIPEELPSGMAKLVSYNPLTHCVGLVREGLVKDYESLASSSLFVLAISVVILTVAWGLINR